MFGIQDGSIRVLMVQVFVCTGRDKFSIFHCWPKKCYTQDGTDALDSLQLATFACVFASWLKTFPISKIPSMMSSTSMENKEKEIKDGLQSTRDLPDSILMRTIGSLSLEPARRRFWTRQHNTTQIGTGSGTQGGGDRDHGSGNSVK